MVLVFNLCISMNNLQLHNNLKVLWSSEEGDNNSIHAMIYFIQKTQKSSKLLHTTTRKKKDIKNICM